MRIIENTGNSHLEEIKGLLADSTEAIIVSPFISEEAVALLSRWPMDHLKSLSFVTTMRQQDYDQVKKVPVLQRLYSAMSEQKVELSVCIDNKLHGKVYIGKKNGIYKKAIVSSANFTMSGLEGQHEWGVYIEEKENIEQIAMQIIDEVERTINEDDLKVMAKWIREHQLKDEKRPRMKVDLMSLIPPRQFEVAKDITYWLKPLGTSERPVLPSEQFSNDWHDITFAKGVKNVKEGDLLIAYAVKTRKILSVFRATGEKGKKTEFDSEWAKKWPYFVKCKNLTSDFGSHWADTNLSLDYLKDSFIKEWPSREVRPGAQDFNVMRRGLDRLKLTKEFAVYVINKVVERKKR